MESLRKAAYANSDPEIREILLSREMFLHDVATDKEVARQQGLEEGRLEGRLEGKLEGRREGKLEGKLEERRNNARRMLKAGISIEQVAAITELPLEEVKGLVN